MSSKPKVYRSKRFITPVVTAVFPHLNKVDQFGNYSVDVDVLDNPELEQAITAQLKQTIKEGQEKFGTDKEPTNSPFRSGEYKDAPFRRVSFKMKGKRNVKGKEVSQRPRLVDAHKAPMTEEVWGGSKIKVAYYIQYTVTPTGTYGSVKLDAVQVIEHVGPGGEVSIDALFDEEDGFTTSGETTESELNVHDAATAPTNEFVETAADF